MIKKKIKKIYQALSLFFGLLAVLLSSLLGEWGIVIGAKADEESAGLNYEKSYVMDDLAGMTIDGEAFDVKNYGFNPLQETSVLTMAEYCYSFDMSRQDNYGLYVYIHNPQALDYVNDSRNSITICVNGAGAFKKYELEMLSVCEETDYERLFYKFQVILTASEKKDVLSRLNSAGRIYEIGEVELRKRGDTGVTPYSVGGRYEYSGYSAGYGANESAASTLKVVRTDTETLSLDVHSTYYRPDGFNGMGDFTQDTLHSVYFAVPNEFIKKYGEMTAVHATWLQAYLKPILVTGSESAYNAILPYLGKNVGKHNSSLNWFYVGGYEGNGSDDYSEVSDWVPSHMLGSVDWKNDLGVLAYNARNFYTDGTGLNINAHNLFLSAGYIPTLYLMFYSGNESALDYVVSGEEIQAAMAGTYTSYGGNPIYGADGVYSDLIFSHVDDEPMDVNVSNNTEWTLKDIKLGQSFWEEIFGGSHVVSSEKYDGIKAIEAIDDSKLTRSKATDSQNLYIAESDCEAFYEFYDENCADKTVYLFRYRVDTDYQSIEATGFYDTEKGVWANGDTYWASSTVPAYFFSEAVDLNFDIIDVTFTADSVETVIPVVAKPIDVIPDGTPPVELVEDTQWWVWLIVAAVALFVVGILCFIFKPVFEAVKLICKAVWAVISAPVRFVIWIVRKIRGDDDG